MSDRGEFDALTIMPEFTTPRSTARPSETEPDQDGSGTSSVAWLYVCILVSGASGLIFEIVWIRALGLHFGSSTPAISAVLAAFMGGLALGNLVFGPRADASRRPLEMYRLLELGIGLSGLAASVLLLHGDFVLTHLARFVANAGSFSTILRFGFFVAFLVVPATLMGGTLPVLARALMRSGFSGRVLGSLYAINTAGAFLGCLAPDLFLIPLLGLTSAAAVATTGNLLVALVVGRMSAKIPEQAPPSPEEAGPTKQTSRRGLLLFSVSGFVAMGVELLWSRVLEHWAGGLVTSFSILLAVYLVAVAAGSMMSRSLADRTRHPLPWAAALLAATGPAIVIPLIFADRWIEWLQAILPQRPDLIRLPLWPRLLEALAHSLYLELAACLLMGLSFPFLAAAVVDQSKAGRHTGRLVAFNTVAGVLGSITACFLFLPWLGLQAGLLLLALFASATGAFVAIGLRRSARQQAMIAGGCAALVAMLWVGLPTDHLQRVHFAGRPGNLISIHEGSTTTAAVAERELFGQLAYMELQTPGVSMSSTSFGARRYMGMMGHLGVFFARQPRNALLICYGVGNTATSLLSHPDLERLDVVDIAREVLDASPDFSPVRPEDPLANKRTTVLVDDGRHHLITSDRLYDVITSEPPPPNNAGVVNLYSSEYYRIARRRLTPGGVLTQWLPVFQLAPEETASIVAAFVGEFPHTALFYGYSLQFILVGSDEPLRIDWSAWQRRAQLPRVARDLESIGIDGTIDLAAAFLQSDSGLRKVAESALPVTDDRPLIQYPWRSVDRLTQLPSGLLGEPANVVDLFVEKSESIPETAALVSAGHLVGILQWANVAPPELWEIAYGSGVRIALAERPKHDATLALLEIDDQKVTLALEATKSSPIPAAAGLTLVRRDFYEGRYASALAGLAQIDPQSVGASRYWLLRGGCERALGRTDEAAASFRRAAEASGWPTVRETISRLADRAGESFPPEAGPLVLGQ